MNKTAVNTFIHNFFPSVNFWEQISRSRVRKLTFHFRSCQIALQKDGTNLHSHPQDTRVPVFTAPGGHCVVECIFISAKGILLLFQLTFLCSVRANILSHIVGHLTLFFVNCLFLQFGSWTFFQILFLSWGSQNFIQLYSNSLSVFRWLVAFNRVSWFQKCHSSLVFDRERLYAQLNAAETVFQNHN